MHETVREREMTYLEVTITVKVKYILSEKKSEKKIYLHIYLTGMYYYHY